jgi:hypothetical protein
VQDHVASHSDAFPPSIAGHGLISVAIKPFMLTRRLIVTDAVTIPDREVWADTASLETIVTILCKFEYLAFDTNLRRVCIETGQKLRFIANDSFNPVC